ncbi:MAG: hypothetical protein HYU03_01625 [Thaumarchaeota archaeon]|nr:hypothetical protein [Nitrososphaerota archaeon]
MALESATPSLTMTGTPQARSSASFVAAELFCAKTGFMKNRPTSSNRTSSGMSAKSASLFNLKFLATYRVGGTARERAPRP